MVGPAGIGKSRLAWEFNKYMDGLVEEVWWHTGRSPAYGEGIPLWSLGEMVRSRCGLLETDDERTTRAKVASTLARFVPEEAGRRWIEPALLALLGSDGRTAGSEQLFAAWRTFFERMAASSPVVMVFEDLHWADSGTLDFIDHLLDWARSVPIYVVTLARPGLLERHPAWGAAKRQFTSLFLEPLAEDAMLELITGLVPGLPDEACRAIVARADGVPLYAVETVRMLVAEGRLVLRDGVFTPSGDLTELAGPDSLTALIAARLDALDPADRALILDAPSRPTGQNSRPAWPRSTGGWSRRGPGSRMRSGAIARSIFPGRSPSCPWAWHPSWTSTTRRSGPWPWRAGTSWSAWELHHSWRPWTGCWTGAQHAMAGELRPDRWGTRRPRAHLPETGRGA